MRQSGGQLAIQLYWPVLPLAVWAITSGAPFSTWLLINLACWPIAFAVSVAMHEGGHALAGLLLAFKPFRLTLGAGSLVAQKQLGALRFELRELAISGSVGMSADSLTAIRLRLWLVFAAGPAATTGLFWLALRFSDGLSIGALSSGPAGWELLGFCNAFVLFFSLYPGHFGGMPSDGRSLLLRIPWVPSSQFEEFLIAEDFDRVSSAIAQRDWHGARELVAQAELKLPGARPIKFTRAAIDLLSGKFVEPRATFLEFLEDPQPAVAALAKNNLAWAAFMERDPQRLDEALSYSAAAVETLSRSAAAHGTRGAVLFWAAKPEDASPHLLRSIALAESPHHRAFSACVLAMICNQSRDVEDAQSWLTKAETWDASCPLLDEAKRFKAPP